MEEIHLKTALLLLTNLRTLLSLGDNSVRRFPWLSNNWACLPSSGPRRLRYCKA